jgi:deoxyribodipyrimidine photo-lyase
VHLRFGTVSIRQLARLAYPLAIQGDAGAQTWLSELIWRDFYHQIMFHHPHAMKRSFTVSPAARDSGSQPEIAMRCERLTLSFSLPSSVCTKPMEG